MEKVPGVESATVLLNEGRAIVKLKSQNGVTLAQVRESVRQNGFTPRDAVVTAHAEAAADGDRLRLKISGTSDLYDVTTTAEDRGLEKLLRESIGRQVVIEGKIPIEKDPRASPVLQVTSVKPSAR
jgi:hypothetical protein